jgi:hypothetical protein
MFKTLLALSMLFSGSVFAQNMADSEKYQDSYIDMPDGSSLYIGKCSTHEDYEKFYFKTEKVLQRYVEPSDLTDAQLRAVLAKFDKSVVNQVLAAFDMYSIEDGLTDFLIFKNYIDDLTVENLSHVVRPDLNLVRFRVGVGGGNGGYIVFNKVKEGAATTYKMMSYTFDSDLSYCDQKVWLQNPK